MTLPIAGIVPGFREGLLLMQPGAIYRLTIPPALAYGEAGAGGVVPPNATLVFTVTRSASNGDGNGLPLSGHGHDPFTRRS